MNLRTVIATATVAAVLGTAGVSLAGAAGSSSSGTPTPAASAPAAPHAVLRHPLAARRRHVRIRALIRRGAARVITTTIGIDRKTLRKDLLAGQTIAQIAGANGVPESTVVANLVKAATAKLEKWAGNGRITHARAAAIEAKLPALITKVVENWHPKRAELTSLAT